MPDVLLFGATGYTGALTAAALGRNGADFIVAGRNRAKLEKLAEQTGAADARVAAVGDVDALTAALSDVKAMITCVGPFSELGDTAAEAALRARVHYVDSTGEISFVDRLIERYGSRAKDAGIVMAPCLGFDEVPADVSLSMAVEGMDKPDAVLTYTLPSRMSAGTLRTIVTSEGQTDARWTKDGRPEHVRIGSRQRWAPMPEPVGPKLSIPLPLAEGRLAPLHLDLRSLELYGITGRIQAAGMRIGAPLAKVFMGFKPVRDLASKVIERLPEGPNEATRTADRWTLLAEARTAATWHNVALSGVDPYGLTAATLAAAGMKLANEGHDGSGVMAPVQAIGLDMLQKVLIDFGVDIQTYEPA